MAKQWKATGPKQEQLERMFDEGSIEEWETPASVQPRYPIFKAFSERVFANNFRITKLKFGYNNSGNTIDFVGYVSKILKRKIYLREKCEKYCTRN